MMSSKSLSQSLFTDGQEKVSVSAQGLVAGR